MPHHIYLCARFGRQAELRDHRATLQALGYHVTSHWLDEPDEAPAPPPLDLERRLALRDIEDLLASDTLLAFTEDAGPGAGRGRGGRHVELGMALLLKHRSDAWTQPSPMRVVIIGPLENIFCTLADAHYPTLMAAVACWWDPALTPWPAPTIPRGETR
jgi:hypothetical protein